MALNSTSGPQEPTPHVGKGQLGGTAKPVESTGTSKGRKMSTTTGKPNLPSGVSPSNLQETPKGVTFKAALVELAHDFKSLINSILEKVGLRKPSGEGSKLFDQVLREQKDKHSEVPEKPVLTSTKATPWEVPKRNSIVGDDILSPQPRVPLEAKSLQPERAPFRAQQKEEIKVDEAKKEGKKETEQTEMSARIAEEEAIDNKNLKEGNKLINELRSKLDKLKIPPEKSKEYETRLNAMEKNLKLAPSIVLGSLKEIEKEINSLDRDNLGGFLRDLF